MPITADSRGTPKNLQQTAREAVDTGSGLISGMQQHNITEPLEIPRTLTAQNVRHNFRE